MHNFIVLVFVGYQYIVIFWCSKAKFESKQMFSCFKSTEYLYIYRERYIEISRWFGVLSKTTTSKCILKS